MKREFTKSLALWEFNSKADALWAVLSDPAKRGGRWNKDEFFRTGENDIRGLFERLHALKLAPASGEALDFGCGVGRLTQGLASRFDRVVGVDAAPTMIRKAREYNRFGIKVSYEANLRPDLSIFAADRFDLILSLIVLQHIPTETAVLYLKEFLRVLAPGGVLVFQVPSREKQSARGIETRAKEAVKHAVPSFLLDLARRWFRPDQPVIPMYPISRSRVESLFEGTSVELIHVEADSWAGDGFESFTYYARKRVQ